MDKLFVDKTIVVSATTDKVWKILTERKFTDQWTNEFMADMTVESDWKLGNEVVWKDITGKVVVEGEVTSVEPGKFLRFTTFDVEMGRIPVTDEDGMTFEITRQGSMAILHVLHGDFAAMTEGQKYYDMTQDAWNKVLPKIKKLAEG